MKARIKGLRKFHWLTFNPGIIEINTELKPYGTCVTPKGENINCDIEADSIEIIDEPEKRGVSAGDVWMDVGANEGFLVIECDGNTKPGPLFSTAHDKKPDSSPVLFNLLDIVAEMRKVKDGKTEKCRAQMGEIEAHKDGFNPELYVTIVCDGELAVSMRYPDAFSFACQLIALCGGKE